MGIWPSEGPYPHDHGQNRRRGLHDVRVTSYYLTK
jgi:hypothetical protein